VAGGVDDADLDVVPDHGSVFGQDGDARARYSTALPIIGDAFVQRTSLRDRLRLIFLIADWLIVFTTDC